jgi:hypothetical protein
MLERYLLISSSEAKVVHCLSKRTSKAAFIILIVFSEKGELFLPR